jgi:hypothetical protein
MKTKMVMIIFLVTGLTLVSMQTYGQTKKNATMDMPATKYTCPQHPDFVSDKPGKCRCGMDLVAVKKDGNMKDNNSGMKNEGMKNDSKDMEMKNDSAMMKKETM